MLRFLDIYTGPGDYELLLKAPLAVVDGSLGEYYLYKPKMKRSDHTRGSVLYAREFEERETQDEGEDEPFLTSSKFMIHARRLTNPDYTLVRLSGFMYTPREVVGEIGERFENELDKNASHPPEEWKFDCMVGPTRIERISLTADNLPFELVRHFEEKGDPVANEWISFRRESYFLWGVAGWAMSRLISEFHALHVYLSDSREFYAPQQPDDAGKQMSEISRRQSGIATEERKRRACIFKAIKDKNPKLSYLNVAIHARQRGIPDAEQHDVINDYRAMGWEWERADKIR